MPAKALRDMRKAFGMHGPCEKNSCANCSKAYADATTVLKEIGKALLTLNQGNPHLPGCAKPEGSCNCPGVL